MSKDDSDDKLELKNKGDSEADQNIVPSVSQDQQPLSQSLALADR